MRGTLKSVATTKEERKVRFATGSADSNNAVARNSEKQLNSNRYGPKQRTSQPVTQSADTAATAADRNASQSQKTKAIGVNDETSYQQRYVIVSQVTLALEEVMKSRY